MCRCEHGICPKDCTCRCHIPAVRECCRVAVEADRRKRSEAPEGHKAMVDLKLHVEITVDAIGNDAPLEEKEMLKEKVERVIERALRQASVDGNLVFQGDNFTMKAVLTKVKAENLSII